MFAFLGKSPEQAKADAQKVLAIETAMSQPEEQSHSNHQRQKNDQGRHSG
jgi:hypothetical protein